MITLICILGIAIGVAALITVQSIMDGLQNKMRATVLGAKTHALVTTESGRLDDYAEKMEKLASNPEIAGVTPVISRDVIISVSDELNGIVINGIDPATVGNAMLLPQQITKGSMICLAAPDKCPEIIEKKKAFQDFTLRKHKCLDQSVADRHVLKMKHALLIPIPTVLCNAIAIPFVLYFGYQVTSFANAESMIPVLLLLSLSVFIGEVISCYVFGPLFVIALNRVDKVLHLSE